MGTPNYLEVFLPFLVSRKASNNSEFAGYCPLHESPFTSRKPSAEFHFENRVFWCFICGNEHVEGADGKMSSLHAAYKRRLSSGDLDAKQLAEHADTVRSKLGIGESQKTADGGTVTSIAAFKSGKNAKAEAGKTVRNQVSQGTIDYWHEILMEDKPEQLKYLTKVRGLKKKTIKAWQIGYSPHHNRYTLPMYDVDGNLIDTRMYKPNPAEDEPKITYYNGGRGVSLFGVDRLGDGDILFVEGEMDCILASQMGFNAITSTGGAGRIATNPEDLKVFAGRRVNIMLDNDSAGYKGSQQVAAALQASGHPSSVVIVRHDVDGADFTDLVVKHGWDKDRFDRLIDDAHINGLAYARDESRTFSANKPVTTFLSETTSRNLIGKPVLTYLKIVDAADATLALPYKGTVECNQDQKALCEECPINYANGRKAFKFDEHDQFYTDAVNVKAGATPATTKRRRALHLAAKAAGALCEKAWIDDEADDYKPINVRVVYAEDISPGILSEDDRVGGEGISSVREVIVVGKHEIATSKHMRVPGVSYIDPNNKMSYQAFDIEPMQGTIDDFQITPEQQKQLRVFRPAKGQKPMQRMMELADELTNVTDIYGRPTLHIAAMLSWHSMLSMNVFKAEGERARLDIAVVGDSRTGKSQVFGRLADFYGYGEMVSCERTGFTGIIGAVIQGSNGWYVHWGKLPANDRLLVILDEAGGLYTTRTAAKNGAEQVIPAMSSMRSSGIAEISKVIGRKTPARCRLVWLFNPVNGKQLSSLPQGGISALRTLFRDHEDIARLDFAMAVSAGDVAASVINSQHEPRAMSFTREDASLLVRWIFSRRSSDIVWYEDTESLILERSLEFGEAYTVDGLGLVQIEDFRLKLARLAIAFAGSLFSCNKDGTKVVVRREHVEAAIEFLDMIYENPHFGYAELARVERRRGAKALTHAKTLRGMCRDDATLRIVSHIASQEGDFTTSDIAGMGNDRFVVDNVVALLESNGLITAGTDGTYSIRPEVRSEFNEMHTRFESREPQVTTEKEEDKS